MRCFHHPGHEAVGVCKNCGRGICSECAALVDDSLACKDRCEEHVAVINEIVRSSPLVRRASARHHRRAGIHALFTGLAFFIMGGIFILSIGHDFGLLLGAVFCGLGMIIAVHGITNFFSARHFDLPKPAPAAKDVFEVVDHRR